MAMTKAEKQQLERLQRQLTDEQLQAQRARSLRYSPGAAPQPDILPEALDHEDLEPGYTWNEHRLIPESFYPHSDPVQFLDRLLTPAVTGQHRHHLGSHNRQAPSWSQRGIRLYSDKLTALHARRRAMEELFAAALHMVDRAIEQETDAQYANQRL